MKWPPVPNDQLADALQRANADTVGGSRQTQERIARGDVPRSHRIRKFGRTPFMAADDLDAALQARLASIRGGAPYSKKEYIRALPYLCVACGICGGKAIYRMGREGRCGKHKDDQQTAGFVASKAIYEQRGRVIEAETADNDKRSKKLAALHGLWKLKRRRA